MLLPPLKLDSQGLVTVIAQDRLTGEIRMVAHANEEALRLTQSSGYAHFFSRSRQRLWMKGESSQNTLKVWEVWVDCDADAVIYLIDPKGPSCHLGDQSCFSRQVFPTDDADQGPSSTDTNAGQIAAPLFSRLEAVLQSRKVKGGPSSYTRSLLEKGALKIGAKLREEADELAEAIAGESDERVASEAADVLYHLMVGLISRGVPLRQVEEVLSGRFGISGIEEKANR